MTQCKFFQGQQVGENNWEKLSESFVLLFQIDLTFLKVDETDFCRRVFYGDHSFTEESLLDLGGRPGIPGSSVVYDAVAGKRCFRRMARRKLQVQRNAISCMNGHWASMISTKAS